MTLIYIIGAWVLFLVLFALFVKLTGRDTPKGWK